MYDNSSAYSIMLKYTWFFKGHYKHRPYSIEERRARIKTIYSLWKHELSYWSINIDRKTSCLNVYFEKKLFKLNVTFQHWNEGFPRTSGTDLDRIHDI